MAPPALPWTRMTPMLLLPLLLSLLGQAAAAGAAPAAAAAQVPLDSLEQLVGSGQVDAALHGVLQHVLAGLTQPQSLREHVQAVMKDDLQTPALLAGAADCDLSLARMVAGLLKLELWVLQMLDSNSKLVTGILYGNSGDLGNFDECVASGPGDDGGKGFTGRYALPALAIQMASNSKTNASVQHSQLLGALSRLQAGRAVPGVEDFKTKLTLRFALCMPSTCRAAVLEAAINKTLNVINPLLTGLGVRLQASLPDEYTYVAGRWRKADLGDWFVIFLCVLLVVLVVLGTTVDLALRKSGSAAPSGFLVSFSAWSNGRRLLAITPPSDTNFTCINGLRFFSAVWVILGHRYRFLAHVPVTNLIIVPKRASDLSTMIITGAPLSVDTFFLIGGMVNCYSFMRSNTGRRTFNLFTYYFHRYVRLTPAFALMMGITATWLSLLSTGPMWYEAAGTASEKCQRSWWSGLLYVGNYANANNQCMMQSWYLSVDMQLHWLSPLLLIPLLKWRKAGLVWLFFLMLVSCAIPFAVTYINEFRGPMSTDLSMEAQDFFMATMYFPTHNRASSYICGTLAGYILFMIKSGKIKRSISHKELVVGWTLSAAVCLTVVFGAQPMYDTADFEYDRVASSFYMGLYRIGWSAGLGWLIIACICGHGGPLNAFLSWGPLTVLGRLSYGIYLTHAAIHIVDYGTIRTPEFYSDFKMVEKTMSDVVISVVLAVCLCLTTESPIIAIERSLRTRPRAKKTEASPVEDPSTLAIDKSIGGPLAPYPEPKPSLGDPELGTITHDLVADNGRDNPGFEDDDRRSPAHPDRVYPELPQSLKDGNHSLHRSLAGHAQGNSDLPSAGDNETTSIPS